MSETDKPAPNEMYWILALVVISAFRLVWVTDLPVVVSSAPHDDYLYVHRAYCLLTGGAFCNYTQTTFEKMPGLSIWIAAMRQLSIPYLLSIHLMLFASTLYLILGLRKAGAPRIVLTLIYTLTIFHQFTFSHAWFRVMREPLILSLHLLIFGGMIHIFHALIHGQRIVRHSLLMAFCLMFAIMTREEDKLLYATFVLFSISFVVYVLARARPLTEAYGPIAAALLPFLLLNTAGWSLLRGFITFKYGLPIVYEMSEGEYPKLLASLRSIVVKNQHPQVMVSQEAIGKAVMASPRLVPVFEKIDLPHPKSESCAYLGICDEWTNGWMIFWIKWAAYDAGVTPNMPAAQEFYRLAHTEIDRACQSGRLQCKRNGDGTVPPFQWRFRTDFWNELKSAIDRTFHLGHGLYRRPELFQERVVFGDFFSATTMTHYFRNFETQHLEHTGDYANARLAAFRPWLVHSYQAFSPRVIFAGLICFLLFLCFDLRSTLTSPVGLVSLIFLVSSAARLLIIAHISTYMKLLEDRIFSSTHLVLLTLGLYWVWALFLAAVKIGRVRIKLPILQKISNGSRT